MLNDATSKLLFQFLYLNFIVAIKHIYIFYLSHFTPWRYVTNVKQPSVLADVDVGPPNGTIYVNVSLENDIERES